MGTELFNEGYVGDSLGGLEELCLGLFLDDLSGCFPCQRGGLGFFSFLFVGFALISGAMRVVIIIAIMNMQRIFLFFRMYSPLDVFYLPKQH